MLSLKKLTSLVNVQVHDNILPVTVHDEIEISDEDFYCEPENFPSVSRNDEMVNYLVSVAKKHKAKCKVIAEKYYPAWIQSMNEKINENGIDQNEFLQLCLKA